MRFSTPETRLAVACAYEEEDVSVEAVQALLPFCETPSRFFLAAAALNIAPAACRALAAAASAAAASPTSFLADIQASLPEEIALWEEEDVRLRAALREVTEALKPLDLPYLFLRGKRFADRHYAQPSLRMSFDVDLLVREEDVRTVIAALLPLSYRPIEKQARREARAAYMGQVELAALKDGRFQVIDLNWRLSGNSGIGKHSRDMEQVWSRTTALEDRERLLSAEDEFVEIIRHFTQGHDFVRHALRTCMDVRAFLRKNALRLSAEAIMAAAEESGCRRGAALFLGYYQKRYPGKLTACEEDLLKSLLKGTSAVERALFSFFVIPAALALNVARGPVPEALLRVLATAAKVCAADRYRHLLRLLRIITLPTRDELHLLGEGDSLARRRTTFALLSASVLVPCFCVGTMLRIVFDVSRIACIPAVRVQRAAASFNCHMPEGKEN